MSRTGNLQVQHQPQLPELLDPPALADKTDCLSGCGAIC